MSDDTNNPKNGDESIDESDLPSNYQIIRKSETCRSSNGDYQQSSWEQESAQRSWQSQEEYEKQQYANDWQRQHPPYGVYGWQNRFSSGGCLGCGVVGCLVMIAFILLTWFFGIVMIGKFFLSILKAVF